MSYFKTILLSGATTFNSEDRRVSGSSLVLFTPTGREGIIRDGSHGRWPLEAESCPIRSSAAGGRRRAGISAERLPGEGGHESSVSRAGHMDTGGGWTEEAEHPSTACSERPGGTLHITQQSVNSTQRASKAHFPQLCCTVSRDSARVASPLPGAHSQPRATPRHGCTQPYHSLRQPQKRSTLERTIYHCRQEERTIFTVKTSKPRPPGWLAAHFCVSPKLHFALQASFFLKHFQEPRIQTSRHRQAAHQLTE